MPLIPLLAMVRKDLQLFFSDRRSVIVSFVVPIAIASFFGSIFSGGAGGNSEPARIARGHRRSRRQRDREGDRRRRADRQEPEGQHAGRGRGRERRSRPARSTVAIVIPAGFGDAAGQALFGGGEKPSLVAVLRPVARHRAGDGSRHDDRARDERRQPRNVRRCAGAQTDRSDRPAGAVLVDAGGSEEAAARDARIGPEVLRSRARRRPGEQCAARHHDAVHRPRRSDDFRNERRLQRLRAFVRRHGDSVPAVRDGQHRRRDAARAAARTVESAAQRTGVEGDAAARQGDQRHGHLAADSPGLVRLRDDRVQGPHPGQRGRIHRRFRSPAR